MKEEVVRKPAVAGSFYPADGRTLARQIREYLAQVPPKEIPGEVLALVSPHAGYIYSGQVAASAFKRIEGMKFDAVIVVGPSHRVLLRGASIQASGGYETPLGSLVIEKEISRKLMEESELIRVVPQAHAQEHSLEVQLPFLQEVLGPFPLVPIVIGDQSLKNCEAIGKAMARAVAGKKVLFVASTDLSHFHSHEEAVTLDRRILDDLRAFDVEKLAGDLESGKGEACGGGPVMAVMVASREMGANHVEVLQYRTSGDVTGDRSEVVGYAAAVITRSPGSAPKPPEGKKAGTRLGLSAEEQKTLRQIARSAIESRLLGGKSLPAGNLTATLQEKRGAFVSLHKQGRLRGCIGLTQAVKPLHQTVEEMAAAAAFDDPRFDPLTRKELQELEIEISVLTPFTRVKDEKEIEIGKHGLYIKKGFYAGLLLPQVAAECGWDRTTFLEQTCCKAGLPKQAWKEKDTEIYLFSADIF